MRRFLGVMILAAGCGIDEEAFERRVSRLSCQCDRDLAGFDYSSVGVCTSDRSDGPSFLGQVLADRANGLEADVPMADCIDLERWPKDPWTGECVYNPDVAADCLAAFRDLPCDEDGGLELPQGDVPAGRDFWSACGELYTPE